MDVRGVRLHDDQGTDLVTNVALTHRPWSHTPHVGMRQIPSSRTLALYALGVFKSALIRNRTGEPAPQRQSVRPSGLGATGGGTTWRDCPVYTLKQTTCQNSPEYVISVLALKQQGPHPLGIWTDLGIPGPMVDHHKLGFLPWGGRGALLQIINLDAEHTTRVCVRIQWGGWGDSDCSTLALGPKPGPLVWSKWLQTDNVTEQAQEGCNSIFQGSNLRMWPFVILHDGKDHFLSRTNAAVVGVEQQKIRNRRPCGLRGSCKDVKMLQMLVC